MITHQIVVVLTTTIIIITKRGTIIYYEVDEALVTASPTFTAMLSSITWMGVIFTTSEMNADTTCAASTVETARNGVKEESKSADSLELDLIIVLGSHAVGKY